MLRISRFRMMVYGVEWCADSSVLWCQTVDKFNAFWFTLVVQTLVSYGVQLCKNITTFWCRGILQTLVFYGIEFVGKI